MKLTIKSQLHIRMEQHLQQHIQSMPILNAIKVLWISAACELKPNIPNKINTYYISALIPTYSTIKWFWVWLHHQLSGDRL